MIIQKISSLFALVIFILAVSSCSRYQKIKYNTFQIASADNNVCKKLYGPVVLYAIFVDSRYTLPWSEYDIQSTLDSINKAKDWLEKMATENGIPLSINIEFHQAGKIIPVVNKFAR